MVSSLNNTEQPFKNCYYLCLVTLQRLYFGFTDCTVPYLRIRIIKGTFLFLYKIQKEDATSKYTGALKADGKTWLETSFKGKNVPYNMEKCGMSNFNQSLHPVHLP